MTTLNKSVDDENCFYCKKNAADKDSFYTKEMYKLTGVSELIIGRSSSFLKKEIKIPRCKRCSRRQENFYIYSFIPTYIAFIILISRALYYNGGGWGWTSAIIASLIFSFFCASAVIFIVGLLFFKFISGIRLDEDVDDYPSVTNLIQNGWLTSKPYPHGVTKRDIHKDIVAQKELMKEMKKKL